MSHLPPKLELEWYPELYPLENSRKVAFEIYGHYQKQFDCWWKKEIEPLFKDAVEVYGDRNKIWTEMNGNNDLYRALLINIQPIKQEPKLKAYMEPAGNLVFDPRDEEHAPRYWKRAPWLDQP